MHLQNDSVWSTRRSTAAAGTNGAAAQRESAAALDIVTDCVFVLDRDYRIVRANRAACEKLGVQADELLGRHCYGSVHGCDGPVDGCPFAKLLADGCSHDADMDEPRVGGRIRVSCSPLTDDRGELVGAVHAFRPAGDGAERAIGTERPAGDAAERVVRGPGRSARPSIPDLGRLLDAMPEQLAVLDPQLRLQWVNAAAAAEAGRSTTELLGRRCYEELYGLHEPCVDCAVVAALKSCRAVESERRDHDGRYLLHRAYPVLTGDGTTDAVVAFTQDVTARRTTEIAVAESANRMRAALQASVRAIGAVIELRDPDTARHQRIVARMAQALATEMGLSDDVVDSLWYAGQLLDIGKLGVPIDILSRPGPLTEVELTLVRVHPAAGEQILADIPLDTAVAQAVGQHHERLDGTGYPHGLQGEQIALEARILAVADVVAAMGMHRPHRTALPIDEVLTELRRGAGTQFDADVVRSLEQLVARGELPDLE